MAMPLQIDPVVEWAPRPVHLTLVRGGGPADAEVYRNRRAAALVLMVLMVIAFGLAVRVGVAVLGGDPASAPGLRPAIASVDAPGTFGGQVLMPGGVYVVQHGDTLWALARALQPEGDVSGLVHRLVRLNGGAELAVGDHLVLPD